MRFDLTTKSFNTLEEFESLIKDLPDSSIVTITKEQKWEIVRIWKWGQLPGDPLFYAKEIDGLRNYSTSIQSQDGRSLYLVIPNEADRTITVRNFVKFIFEMARLNGLKEEDIKQFIINS